MDTFILSIVSIVKLDFQLYSLFWLDIWYFIIVFEISQLIADKLKNGSDNVTFMERLIRIADENDDFDLEDVRAEAMNTLTAVWQIRIVIKFMGLT